MKSHLISLQILIATLACFSSSAGDPEPTEKRENLGFVSIFDGKTLKGWRADPESNADAWVVKDGVIRGEGKEDRLAYLIYSGDEELEDFELKFSYRMVTEGNTGVEIRTRIDKSGKRPFEGYHADLGHVGIGDGVLGAWDFHFGAGGRKEFPCKRGTKLIIDKEGKGTHTVIKDAVRREDIKKRDWNTCRIIAKGSHFRFFINGKLASEFEDNIGEGLLEKGFIGLQLHDKGMIVEFMELELKKF